MRAVGWMTTRDGDDDDDAVGLITEDTHDAETD